MNPFLTTIIAVFGSVLASSGFWAWMQKRGERKSVSSQMLLGIAHDRLTYLCLKYIEQKQLTKEEFENIDKYLYTPYKKLGGNGTITRLMEEVYKLPIKGGEIYFKDGDYAEHE